MATDLENILLPDFILADLYKNTLVVLDDVKPKKAIVQTVEASIESSTKLAVEPIVEALPAQIKSTHKPEKIFLGDNKKNITILVKENNAVYLNDESLNFLSNILGACKLNLGDVAIVNHQTEPMLYPLLKEQLSPNFLLLFDVSPTEINLPFTIPFYQVQAYNNCSFLTAPSLQNMLGTSQEAKLEKSKLWLSLKKMFGL